MILKRKILSLSTIGAAALLVSGPSMAAPPTDFTYGDYEVAAGNISNASCGGGLATCTVLVQDQGVLQRQVTTSVADGNKQYIQTIIVDNAATTGAGVTAIDQGTGAFNLDFTNESFVGINAQQGDLATQSSVALLADTGAGQGPTPSGATADTAQNQMVANVDQGNLMTPGEAIVKVKQIQALDNAGSSLSFWLESNGTGETDRFMELNQVVGSGAGGLPNPEGLTVRRSSGSFTTQAGADTLDLPPGSPDGGTSLAYSTGDDIGTVWLQLHNFGGAGLPGGAADTILQMQSFSVTPQTNVGGIYTASGPTVTNTWNTCASGSFGACNNVLASGVSTWSYWDPNLGPAPSPIVGGTNANPASFFPVFP